MWRSGAAGDCWPPYSLPSVVLIDREEEDRKMIKFDLNHFLEKGPSADFTSGGPQVSRPTWRVGAQIDNPVQSPQTCKRSCESEYGFTRK